MIVKLHDEAFAQAKKLIEEGKVMDDKKSDWSDDNPSTDEQNAYIEKHGIQKYGKWFLGINPNYQDGVKERYEFPYGDFTQVHRGGIIAAKIRAEQYTHPDIEKAVSYLLTMIDKKK